MLYWGIHGGFGDMLHKPSEICNRKKRANNCCSTQSGTLHSRLSVLFLWLVTSESPFLLMFYDHIPRALLVMAYCGSTRVVVVVVFVLGAPHFGTLLIQRLSVFCI